MMVPTPRIARADRVTSPSMHIYYGTRVADADDALPRHVGAASSQVAFASALVRGMRRTRGA